MGCVASSPRTTTTLPANSPVDTWTDTNGMPPIGAPKLTLQPSIEILNGTMDIPTEYAVFACAAGFETHCGFSYAELMVRFFSQVTEACPYDAQDSSLYTDPCLTQIKIASNWTKFECFKGEVPALKQLRNVKGIVITGSAYDAHATDVEWVNKLRTLVYQIYERTGDNYDLYKKRMMEKQCKFKQNLTEIDTIRLRKDLKMIGICFGHQIIANAINDTYGTGPSPAGWEIGIRTVKLNECFYAKYMQAVNIGNKKKTINNENSNENNTVNCEIKEDKRSVIDNVDNTDESGDQTVDEIDKNVTKIITKNSNSGTSRVVTKTVQNREKLNANNAAVSATETAGTITIVTNDTEDEKEIEMEFDVDNEQLNLSNNNSVNINNEQQSFRNENESAIAEIVNHDNSCGQSARGVRNVRTTHSTQSTQSTQSTNTVTVTVDGGDLNPKSLKSMNSSASASSSRITRIANDLISDINKDKNYSKFCKFMSEITHKKELKICEVHRDCVAKTPDNGILLGSSEHTRNEMYIINNNILCLQGHPEYSCNYLKLVCSVYGNKGVLPSDVVKKAKKELDNDCPDSLIWKKMLMYWLAN